MRSASPAAATFALARATESASNSTPTSEMAGKRRAIAISQRPPPQWTSTTRPPRPRSATSCGSAASASWKKTAMSWAVSRSMATRYRSGRSRIGSPVRKKSAMPAPVERCDRGMDELAAEVFGPVVVDEDGRDVLVGDEAVALERHEVLGVGSDGPRPDGLRAGSRSRSQGPRSRPRPARPNGEPRTTQARSRGRRATCGGTRQGCRSGRRSGRRAASSRDCRMAARAVGVPFGHETGARRNGSAMPTGSVRRWIPTASSSMPWPAISTGPSRRSCLAHQDRIYSIALRMLGDPRDAEEAAQDAFVRAYRALGGYDATRIRELRLRAWLATIVLNLCRSRIGRRVAAGQRPLSLDAAPAGQMEPVAEEAVGPAAHALRVDAASRWAGLLLTLPPAYRSAVVLRHVDGLSYPEVAAALDRPEGTVKAQVHRGLALLRTAFEAAEGHRTPGDDRMIADDKNRERETEAAMAGLLTTAPPTFASDVLVEVGLADRYARMDSPIGPLTVVWNGVGVSSVETVDVPDDAEFEAAHRGDDRPSGLPRRRASSTTRVRDPAPPRWRSAHPHRPRSARPDRIRARRLVEGPRDPARRGPAVRLDRGRDRATEGRPGGRDRAWPQPCAAHRARATGSSGRTACSGSTRWEAPATSGRSWRPRVWTCRRWSGSQQPASATSAPTRRRSSACRPAGMPAG